MQYWTGNAILKDQLVNFVTQRCSDPFTHRSKHSPPLTISKKLTKVHLLPSEKFENKILNTEIKY